MSSDPSGQQTTPADSPDSEDRCLGKGEKSSCNSRPRPPFPTCPEHVDQFWSGEIYGESWAHAAAAVDEVFADARWCGWCFTQLRVTDPEYDEAEAKRLSVGDTKLTFESKGHQFNEDGTVDPTKSYRLTEGATVEDGTLYCGDCGRPDGDADGGRRPKATVHDALDNLLDSVDVPFRTAAVEAAHDIVNVSLHNGKDTDRLALVRSLAHALFLADSQVKPAQR